MTRAVVNYLERVCHHADRLRQPISVASGADCDRLPVVKFAARRFAVRRLVGVGPLALCLGVPLHSGCTGDDVVAEWVVAAEEAAQPSEGAPLPGDTDQDAGALTSPGLDAAPSDLLALDAGTACLAEYCNDFERPFSDDEVATGGGLVERTTSPAYEGDFSLRLGIDDGSNLAVLQVPIETVTSGDLFVRVYLYVPAETVLRDIVALSLSDPSGAEGINVDLWEGDRFELFFPASDISDFSNPGTVLRDRWMCLVLQTNVDEDNGAVTLSRDGEVIANAEGVDTLPPGGIGRLGLGVTWRHPEQGSAEVFVDAVALGSAALACDESG